MCSSFFKGKSQINTNYEGLPLFTPKNKQTTKKKTTGKFSSYSFEVCSLKAAFEFKSLNSLGDHKYAHSRKEPKIAAMGRQARLATVLGTLSAQKRPIGRRSGPRPSGSQPARLERRRPDNNGSSEGGAPGRGEEGRARM